MVAGRLQLDSGYNKRIDTTLNNCGVATQDTDSNRTDQSARPPFMPPLGGSGSTAIDAVSLAR